jgi:hypothetical protein
VNQDFRVYFTTKDGHRSLRVSAPSGAAARAHVALRFPGAIIGNANPTAPTPKGATK